MLEDSVQPPHYCCPFMSNTLAWLFGLAASWLQFPVCVSACSGRGAVRDCNFDPPLSQIHPRYSEIRTEFPIIYMTRGQTHKCLFRRCHPGMWCESFIAPPIIHENHNDRSHDDHDSPALLPAQHRYSIVLPHPRELTTTTTSKIPRSSMPRT